MHKEVFYSFQQIDDVTQASDALTRICSCKDYNPTFMEVCAYEAIEQKHKVVAIKALESLLYTMRISKNGIGSEQQAGQMGIVLRNLVKAIVDQRFSPN